MESCTFSNVVEQRKVIKKEFSSKGWGLIGTEQTFVKSTRHVARRQDEATALTACRIYLVFLYCNTHTD